MRLIGKLLALPFMLVTGILYLVCKFLVVLSGAVLGILSGIIFLAALVLFFVAGFLPGLAWLMIAFLISPYGLPLAAAWLVQADSQDIGTLSKIMRMNNMQKAAKNGLLLQSINVPGYQ